MIELIENLENWLDSCFHYCIFGSSVNDSLLFLNVLQRANISNFRPHLTYVELTKQVFVFAFPSLSLFLLLPILIQLHNNRDIFITQKKIVTKESKETEQLKYSEERKVIPETKKMSKGEKKQM